MTQPPTYTIQPITTLTKGDCCMPVPTQKSLGPCIRVNSLIEKGWNIVLKGQIVTLPPVKVETEAGPILQRNDHYRLNGVSVHLGQEIELELPRDSQVAIPNPMLGNFIRSTEKVAICREGKIHVVYYCPNLPQEWQEHFYQAIKENMAQKHLYLSDMEKKGNAVSGIINTTPGHPMHSEPSIPYMPLAALFIRSTIQPIEEKHAIDIISQHTQGKNIIQKVDGEWMVNLCLRGRAEKKKLENLALLQAALAETFLQLETNNDDWEEETEASASEASEASKTSEPSEPKSPFDNDGRFHGFICRHPDTLKRMEALWEGKPIKINL